MLRPDSMIYYSLDATANVGIVVSTAVLMYAHYSSQGGKIKFYAYDVMFDGRTYKNVPEETLRGLKEISKDDETDTE
jgi:hypothetical protein